MSLTLSATPNPCKLFTASFLSLGNTFSFPAHCLLPSTNLHSLCGRRQGIDDSRKERLWSCVYVDSWDKHLFIILLFNLLMFLKEHEAFEKISSSKYLYLDSPKTEQRLEGTVLCTLENEVCLDHGSSQ